MFLTFLERILVVVITMAVLAAVIAGARIPFDYILTKCQDKLDKCSSLWGKVWYNFLMGLSVMLWIFLAAATGCGIIYILIQLQ